MTRESRTDSRAVRSLKVREFDERDRRSLGSFPGIIGRDLDVRSRGVDQDLDTGFLLEVGDEVAHDLRRCRWFVQVLADLRADICSRCVPPICAWFCVEEGLDLGLGDRRRRAACDLGLQLACSVVPRDATSASTTRFVII